MTTNDYGDTMAMTLDMSFAAMVNGDAMATMLDMSFTVMANNKSIAMTLDASSKQRQLVQRKVTQGVGN